MSHYYGGTPWEWVSVIPRGVVRASLRMMPRLDAEESMLTAQRVAVGTGSLEKGAGARITRDWQRVINRGRGSERVTSRRGMEAVLSQAGVGFRRRTPKNDGA